MRVSWVALLLTIFHLRLWFPLLMVWWTCASDVRVSLQFDNSLVIHGALIHLMCFLFGVICFYFRLLFNLYARLYLLICLCQQLLCIWIKMSNPWFYTYRGNPSPTVRTFEEGADQATLQRLRL